MKFPKLVFLLVALLTLNALALAGPAKEGDDLVGASYGFAGPEVKLDDREVEYGASWAHFWKDNLTTEVDLTRPRASAGQYAASIAGAYHWSALYILGGAGYEENQEGFDVHAGAGLNFFAGTKLNLAFEGRALIDPSGSGDLSERVDYRAAGKIRFRF